MSFVSIRMWKNMINVWELNQRKAVPIFNRLCTTASTSSEQQEDKLLTKDKARTLVMNLTNEERDNLAWCLNHLESEEIKAEYRGSVTMLAFYENVHGFFLLYSTQQIYSYFIPVYVD